VTAAAPEKPRSRAALLSGQLEKLYAARDKLEARLAELPELEEQARLEALQKAPTQRTDALGSPAQQLHAEFTKKVAALDRLQVEISAVERATRESSSKSSRPS
jgi:hypothetical protein